MLLQLHLKNQKISMHWLLIICEKPHFGSTLSSFRPKNFKNHAKHQKSLMHWLLIISEELHFGPILSSFWSKKLKNAVLLKKQLRSIVKKSEKFWKSIFHKPWKKNHLSQFSGFCATSGIIKKQCIKFFWLFARSYHSIKT